MFTFEAENSLHQQNQVSPPTSPTDQIIVGNDVILTSGKLTAAWTLKASLVIDIMPLRQYQLEPEKSSLQILSS